MQRVVVIAFPFLLHNRPLALQKGLLFNLSICHLLEFILVSSWDFPFTAMTYFHQPLPNTTVSFKSFEYFLNKSDSASYFCRVVCFFLVVPLSICLSGNNYLLIHLSQKYLENYKLLKRCSL